MRSASEGGAIIADEAGTRDPGAGPRDPGPALAPARIDFGTTPPRAPDYGDLYHPSQGALAQARHVFLGGNGLPARWAGCRSFAILETGFGLGHNFLALWQAWRDSHPDTAEGPRTMARAVAAGRIRAPAFLDVVSVERHPVTHEDLCRAHALSGVPADLSAALRQAWPPAVQGLHRLDFDGGQVRLTLALGDVAEVVPSLVGRFDAFCLDGFAPDRNPAMWDARLMKALARLARPGATLATWSVARPVREGLAAAGFAVSRAAGFGGKRAMTVARFTPRVAPAIPPGRPRSTWHGPREAVVVGAGLAGAAVARSLADRGWRCTVLDAAAAPAQGASGNPAGLFHGVVHPGDGVHARVHRHAALLAARRYTALIRAGLVPGQAEGLLVVQPEGDPDAMPTVAGYVETWDAARSSQWVGLPLPGPAGHYPAGGWIDPSALVRHQLDHPDITFIGDAPVAGFDPPDAAEACRTLRDAAGRVLARAPLIVLAAGPGLREGGIHGLRGLPALGSSLGQVSWFAADGPPPRVPVSGHGYALKLGDGQVLCGATTQPEGSLAGPQEAHLWNLQRLHRLTGLGPAGPVYGRQGMRIAPTDRLPLIGPLPVADPRAAVTQARRVPRLAGVYVAGGFGSRGLIWAPLAGALIAAWVENEPLPLPSDLLDAVDPARGLVRQARRASGTPPSPARGAMPGRASP